MAISPEMMRRMTPLLRELLIQEYEGAIKRLAMMERFMSGEFEAVFDGKAITFNPKEEP